MQIDIQRHLRTTRKGRSETCPLQTRALQDAQPALPYHGATPTLRVHHKPYS